MGFLLGDANFRQHIEDGLAFNFQLPGEIVDSNFAHPCFWCLHPVPLSLHINLTVSVVVPNVPVMRLLVLLRICLLDV